jgi:hypothetical protein
MDHIFSVESTAGGLLSIERPESADERAAMRAELELLRNELKRLDDLTRSGGELLRYSGSNTGYTSDGAAAQTELTGSIVVRG